MKTRKFELITTNSRFYDGEFRRNEEPYTDDFNSYYTRTVKEEYRLSSKERDSFWKALNKLLVFNLLNGYSTSILGLIFMYSIVRKRSAKVIKRIIDGKRNQYSINKKRFKFGFNTDDEGMYCIREIRMPHLKRFGLRVDERLRYAFSSGIFKGEHDSVRIRDNSPIMIEAIKAGRDIEEIKKHLKDI
jgi:hypothetical protein